MKLSNYILASFASAVLLFGCNDLDLNPLSEGSTNNWYNNEVEINMSVNDLYKSAFWGADPEDWTDNWINREVLTPITSATLNGEWGTITTTWSNTYKAISRSNTLINNLEDGDSPVAEELIQRYIAEARFVRAYQYAKLIFYFGDVVFYTNTLDLDDAYDLSRTDKNTILEAIYEDFDYAIQYLPESYPGSSVTRATKGAALAFKAQTALHQGDWAVARDAAKACLDLGVYELYPDFQELFYSKTGRTSETIFSVPRSSTLGVRRNIRPMLPRNVGGWGGQHGPSWDLWCSFLCIDGLPIDESPLFDPSKPFENRDPRCGYTITPFGSAFLGYIYEPHPDSTQILNLNTGEYQPNNDCRTNQQYASFNGLVLAKGVDETWSDDFYDDSDIILMRLADVLLMFAEAKIELGEIDESVLNAINQVRARAYGVDVTSTDAYPAVTATDQEQLRNIIRIERRMEFAFEGSRYKDIIRWRIAEKVLNRPNYMMLDPAELKEKVVDKGGWFFPIVPEIDEDGSPDFSQLASMGLIKQITNRKFDAGRQYLWPIPTKEVLTNSNLNQNPGY